MSYGKHQSFYLKSHWITKGLKAFSVFDNTIIYDKNAYLLLGIGKNMHQSLRYWLESCNVVKLEEKSHALTEFGSLILDYDIGCNLNLTINLLHYFLVNQIYEYSQKSDSFYWFFNIYNENIFTKEKLLNDLILWNKNSTSSRTLNRDVDCLLSLYTKNIKEHPEDKNVSLLSNLGLIYKDNENYIKASIHEENLSLEAIYFILLIMKKNNISLSLSNIISHESSPGRAFNLSRLEVIDIIEKMIYKGYLIEITRTNNLDTVYISENISEYDFLLKAYQEQSNDKI